MRSSWFEPMARTVGIVLVLALASCSKTTTNTAETSTPGSSAPTTDQQQQPSQLAVSHIELGRNVDAEQRVTELTHSFKPNETVYATVVTNGTASNAEIKTRWVYEDGKVIEEKTENVSPNGNTAVAFHVAKAEGLPAGKYKVEVFVNGQPMGTEEFEVVSS